MVSERSSQIWILLLRNSGRPALWDATETEGYELCVDVWVCVNHWSVATLTRTAGQFWQVNTTWCAVAFLCERVTGRQQGHLTIKEAFSSSLNPFSFSVILPCLFYICSPSSPLLNPSLLNIFLFAQLLVNLISAWQTHLYCQILSITPLLLANSSCHGEYLSVMHYTNSLLPLFIHMHPVTTAAL